MKGIPEHVKTILSRLEAAGHEAYCVGGAVRDRLLGRAPGDWDVTTSALPEEVSALFAPHALPTGLRHGTVTVKPEGVPGVEVTTYRRDGAYSDCRRPDSVEFTASLEEDLARRDFTVNAMALDLRGALADPFGGGEDLKRGLLRAVGEPEKRFGEDALRILRGLRFAARLGFSIEAGTDRALRACAPLLERIAPERVREELTGILCGPYAETVLRSYPDVLGVVLPEIAPSVGFDQRSVYHCYDVWEHTARAVGAAPSAPVLRWTMLLHDLGKPDTFFLDGEGRGHFYGHWRKSAEYAGAILDQAPEYRDRQVLIGQWEDLLNLVLQEGACFSLRQLAVRGGDLTALGLRGPAVGRVLQALLDQVLDGKLPNDREILLHCVREELL